MDRQEIICETGEYIFHVNMLMHSKLMNFQNMAKISELPPSHIKVLFFLKKMGEKTMSELAKIMEVSKPNLTPIVDRLLEEKLIARKEAQKDKRKLVVEITRDGETFIHMLHEKAKEKLGERLAEMSEEDLLKLHEATKTLQDVLKKL